MSSVSLIDLREKVYVRVEGNTRFYPQSDVDARINEGLKITNLFAGWSQDQVSIGLTIADRSIYRLPSPILFPMRIYMDGIEIHKETYGTIGNTERAWLRGVGSPTRYWMPLGLRMLALFPTDKQGGKLLEAWGVTEPATLTADSDEMTLADDMVDLIVEYAFMNLVLKEGGKIFTDAAKLYKGWLKKMRTLQRFEAEINPQFKVQIMKEAA